MKRAALIAIVGGLLGYTTPADAAGLNVSNTQDRNAATFVATGWAYNACRAWHPASPDVCPAPYSQLSLHYYGVGNPQQTTVNGAGAIKFDAIEYLPSADCYKVLKYTNGLPIVYKDGTRFASYPSPSNSGVWGTAWVNPLLNCSR